VARRSPNNLPLDLQEKGKGEPKATANQAGFILGDIKRGEKVGDKRDRRGEGGRKGKSIINRVKKRGNAKKKTRVPSIDLGGPVRGGGRILFPRIKGEA